VLFIVAIAGMGLELFSITLGQYLPVEIIDKHLQWDYLRFIIITFPLFVMLTLLKSVRAEKTPAQNAVIIIKRTFTALVSFFVVGAFCFFAGFACWTTSSVIYKNTLSDTMLVEQYLDCGAFGTGDSRKVALIPVCGIWNIVIGIN
jgi:hypothetical protein